MLISPILAGIDSWARGALWRYGLRLSRRQFFIFLTCRNNNRTVNFLGTYVIRNWNRGKCGLQVDDRQCCTGQRHSWVYGRSKNRIGSEVLGEEFKNRWLQNPAVFREEGITLSAFQAVYKFRGLMEPYLDFKIPFKAFLGLVKWNWHVCKGHKVFWVHFKALHSCIITDRDFGPVLWVHMVATQETGPVFGRAVWSSSSFLVPPQLRGHQSLKSALSMHDIPIFMVF